VSGVVADPTVDATPWSTPRRLHPLSPLIGLVREVRRLFVLVFLIVLGVRGSGGLLEAVAPGVVALLGILEWLRTTFAVTAQELRIDSGVFVRQNRTARFDRIQAVDIDQPLVTRMFGLAELRVQLAGGHRGHFLLRCVRQSEAAQLRAHLLERATGIAPAVHATAPQHGAALAAPSAAASVPAVAAASASVSESAVAAAPPAQRAPQFPPLPLRASDAYADGIPYGVEWNERPLAAVPNGRFIASLLLSGPVWGAALILACGVVMFLLWGAAAVSGSFSVFAAAGVYIWDRFQRYFGFTLTESTDGLRLRHGLLNRFAQTIPPGRVQAYETTEPLLWRLAGWARLRITVAGYAKGGGRGESRRTASVLLPVVPREFAFQLVTYLTGTDVLDKSLAPAPTRARWRVGPWWRAYGVAADARIVVARYGLLARKYTIVPHAKVQSIAVHQGPWQRTLGLASVRLHTTRGPVSVALKQRDAAEAAEFVARQTERSNLARRAEDAATDGLVKAKS
jgi:putative membrane protein